jgi:hypothetical protein
MTMQFDFEDVLAGAFGRIILLVFFMLSAAWLGSIIGGLAWFIGNWDLSAGYLVSEFPTPWECPELLLSDWMIPNIALLGAGIAILFVTDHLGYAAWGIFVGLESAFAMLGTGYRYISAGELVLVSLAWLVLLAMVETGIWLIRQMRTNRWVYHLAALSAENAMRRAEREAPARAGDRADDGGGRN